MIRRTIAITMFVLLALANGLQAQTPPILGATPRPTKADLARQDKYIAGIVDPTLTLDLIVGRPRLILLKSTPKRIQLADESMAAYNLIDAKQLTIMGLRPGNTVLNLWFADGDKEKVMGFGVRGR